MILNFLFYAICVLSGKYQQFWYKVHIFFKVIQSKASVPLDGKLCLPSSHLLLLFALLWFTRRSACYSTEIILERRIPF